MSYDSTADTKAHIREVRERIEIVRQHLASRALDHDRSKLLPPEKEAFDHTTPLLKVGYGTPEYEEGKKALGEALTHHYAENDHHPEWEAAHEEWQTIPSAPSYEVSSLGRVRSVSRTVKRRGEKGNMLVGGKLLKAHLTPNGYLRLQLSVDEKPTNRLVHVLVAEAFLEQPREGQTQVNHKDGIKSNNRARNLEWSTPSENLQHAYDTGLREPNAKYLYSCPELGLEAIGGENMAKLLQASGYPEASSAGVWSAAVGDSKTHCGLLIEAQPLAKAPEYTGISGMSLIALLEMFCDWKAASLRHKDGDFAQSIKINIERFEISPQLASILENTRKELEW